MCWSSKRVPCCAKPRVPCCGKKAWDRLLRELLGRRSVAQEAAEDARQGPTVLDQKEEFITQEFADKTHTKNLSLLLGTTKLSCNSVRTSNS